MPHSAVEQRKKDDAIPLESGLDSYEKHIGAIEPRPVAEACIEISLKAHRLESYNYIGDAAGIVNATDNSILDFPGRAVQFPGKNTVLFKRGYATGLTAGKLGMAHLRV